MDSENMVMDGELSNIVTLTDEDGTDVNFELLDLIEYNGEEYIVLMPVDEYDGEVVILGVQENDDDVEYTSVENEETLNAVFEVFKEKNKDNFNFI